MLPYITTTRDGFTPIEVVSPWNFKNIVMDESKRTDAIKAFCKELDGSFKNYNWAADPCGQINWRVENQSKNGRPLIYAVFGEGKETTLILGGVHGNEITPVPLAFKFARYLSTHLDTLKSSNSRVVIAPIVNPDGFLIPSPTRTNAGGVDLNRNFFTEDWYARSKIMFKMRRERSPDHYPGRFPNSEPETIFQVGLIDEFKPDKILSIHAPLGFLDYDGPGEQKSTLTTTEAKAKRLVTAVSEQTKNYRVVDYTYFPGSLGNYAGNERSIPTITLELETTTPSLAESYWTRFLPGLVACVTYPFENGQPVPISLLDIYRRPGVDPEFDQSFKKATRARMGSPALTH